MIAISNFFERNNGRILQEMQNLAIRQQLESMIAPDMGVGKPLINPEAPEWLRQRPTGTPIQVVAPQPYINPPAPDWLMGNRGLVNPPAPEGLKWKEEWSPLPEELGLGKPHISEKPTFDEWINGYGISSALEKYNEGDEKVATVGDVADIVSDVLYEKEAEGDLTDSDYKLQRAIAKYRKEQEYDRKLSGRGDMETADEKLVSAIEKWKSQLTSEYEKKYGTTKES